MLTRAHAARIAAFLSAAMIPIVIGLGGVARAAAPGLRTPPLPAGALGGTLASVSCASPGACEAVGWIELRGHRRRALAERWNGSAWRIGRLTIPAGAGNTALAGVSCPTPAVCVAVGTQGAHGGAPFAVSFSGRSWTAEPMPAVPSGAELLGVSCPTVSFCLAVGDTDTIDNATTNELGLNEVWDGTSWRALRDREDGFLEDVSCVTPAFCFGVGYNANSGGYSTVTESWNGLTITDQSADASGDLSAVSCSSSLSCLAVGSDQGNVAALWNGRRWRGTAAARGLNDVSCVTATACVGVGSMQSGSVLHLRVARWNGSAWAAQRQVPSPADTSLYAVSCPSRAACLAVGDRGNRPFSLRLT